MAGGPLPLGFSGERLAVRGLKARGGGGVGGGGKGGGPPDLGKWG